MKCPFCSNETVPGYIQSGRVVFFTTKKHKLFFIPGEGETELTKSNMTSPNCVAYHCPKCKKVIVDYGKEE